MTDEQEQQPFTPENILLYAPIGMVFTVKDMLPTVVNMLADRGRDQMTKLQNSVNNTYVLAKSMGEMRVNQAQQEGKRRADQVKDAAAGGLRVVQGFGQQAQDVASKSAQTAAQQAQTVIGSGAGAAKTETGRSTNGSGAVGTRSKAPDLAIPDYDTLSAVNVAERLESLSKPELEAIREYEADHKARKTVLGKIDSLLAG